MSDQKTEQKPDHEKRIREALEAGPQAWNYDSNMRPFYNDPEGHSRGGEFDGTYTLFGADFEIDGEAYEGPTLSERCKEADAKFIAACNPAAIRALLADLDAVRGALSAAKDGGWVAVPVEPTQAMLDAADKVQDGCNFGLDDIYKAMLAARPIPNPPKGEV